MRVKAILSGILLLGLGAGGAAAQTDVGLSLYGAYTGKSSGDGILQSPSNAAGGLAEVRHIRNPLIGYEATYSFNRANQVYSPTVSCGLPCANPLPVSISANAHEITGDWIASIKLAHIRPFALAGVGLLLDVPVGGQGNTSTSARPVYVYGGGIDWGVLPHLGVRFQYRGNLYKTPDLTQLYTSANKFTQTAEPMIGAYFRF